MYKCFTWCHDMETLSTLLNFSKGNKLLMVVLLTKGQLCWNFMFSLLLVLTTCAHWCTNTIIKERHPRMLSAIFQALFPMATMLILINQKWQDLVIDDGFIWKSNVIILATGQNKNISMVKNSCNKTQIKILSRPTLLPAILQMTLWHQISWMKKYILFQINNRNIWCMTAQLVSYGLLNPLTTVIPKGIIELGQCCLVESLTPRRFEWSCRSVIFNLILAIDGWGITCKIILMWLSLELTYDQSTLIQAMA